MNEIEELREEIKNLKDMNLYLKQCITSLNQRVHNLERLSARY